MRARVQFECAYRVLFCPVRHFACVPMMDVWSLTTREQPTRFRAPKRNTVAQNKHPGPGSQTGISQQT